MAEGTFAAYSISMTYEDEKNYPEVKVPMEDDDLPHYHGHTVRQIFFACGIIMMLGLTFFYDQIRFGAFLPLLGILILALIAGFTNPWQKASIILDVVVSLAGVAFFELSAVYRYQAYKTLSDGYFIFAQLLGILFFIALYFSTKSLRTASLHLFK